MTDQVLTVQDQNVDNDNKASSRLPVFSKLPKLSGLKPPIPVEINKRKLSPVQQASKKQRTASNSSSSASSNDDTKSLNNAIAFNKPPLPQGNRLGQLKQPPPFPNSRNQLSKASSYSTLLSANANAGSNPSAGLPARKAPVTTNANKVKKPAATEATTTTTNYNKKQPLTAVAIKIRDLEAKIREAEGACRLESEIREQQTQEYESRINLANREKKNLESTISSLNDEVHSMKLALATAAANKAALEAELLAAKELIHQHEMRIKNQNGEIQSLKSKIDDCVSELEGARLKSMQEETIRRQLHNSIQELKGNIRVFSRVRPLLGDELLGMDSDVPPHINFPDPDKKIIELEKPAVVSPNESVVSTKKGSTSSCGGGGGGGVGGNSKYEFQFDRVFQPSATQEEVFVEISQLVQSALDGYNVCIFAYGQTGSGKTYTMEGRGTQQYRGVIPRSVEKIFNARDVLLEKGWKYTIEVSFLEIYNETIRDLLSSQSKNDDTKHEIKLVGPNTNEVFVTDLTTVTVDHEDEVQVLLKRASENRSVAETKCNERSSRSHSIFRMKITGSNHLTAESCVGILNLVDLAGSERLKESGSQGQRLKETQNINKSLANLSCVIMALANKEAHVPYRNSKLTHLLQNCLGGSSKMLMFVNVSPKEECYMETINSLRFAKQVNQCNIGPAQKKTK